MFHVANNSFLQPHHHHQRNPVPSPTVHLPRTLSRPLFQDISKHAIVAVAPDLADVPPEYIRRGLRVKAAQMQSGISSLSPSHMPSSLQKSHLPPYLTIPIRVPATSPAAPAYPTHILALSSSKSSSPSDTLPLFPIHSLVLASHCANLPRLPPSSSHSASTSLVLPILPLTLPSPAAFPLLLAYIYSHALPALLSGLLPFPPTFTQSLASPHAHAALNDTLSSGPKLHQLSVFLCAHAKGSLQALTAHAGHVTALWRNAAALGVYEPELWDAMDLAWEVVLGALNLAAAN